MRYNRMCREELLQTLRRSDLALFASGSRLVVVAHSGAASRLVQSARFQQALTRERAFIERWLADDDAALCIDSRGHERHYRRYLDALGCEYTACSICGSQRLALAASRPVVSMAAYQRMQIDRRAYRQQISPILWGSDRADLRISGEARQRL